MVEQLLPKEWVDCDLNQLLDYVTSGSRDWSQYYSDAGVNFIRTQDINQNRLDLSSVAKVKLPEKVEGKRTLVRKDDILITITGANVGKCARVDFSPTESYVSQSVALVRLTDPTMSAFIQRQIIAPVGDQTALQKAAYGMGRPVLNLNNIREFKVKFPPLAEQKVIAEKLDTLLAQVDNTKARLERMPEILKRFRQSVLAAAVSGKLTEDWRGTNDYETKGSKLLPIKWDVAAAQDVCVKVQSGSTPRDNPFDQNGTIPFLKVYNIVNQKIDFDYKPQFVTEKVHKAALKRSIAEPNDILMNIVGPPLGKVAVLTDQYPEWNLNQAITLFRVEPSKLNHLFLYHVLCEGELVREVMPDTKGSVGQVNISLSQCRDALLPIPPLEEQTEIVRRVEELFAFADRIEHAAQAALSRVNNLTQSILAKAFRGELTADWRAANPELISGEHSAEALLARIKAERAKVSIKKSRKVAVLRSGCDESVKNY